MGLLTSADCLKKYGAPESEKAMTLWDVPKELEIGVIPKRLYCNKDMIKPLTAAFQNLIKTGYVKELKTWDGCVSGDTEYFVGDGWKPISKYTGGLVGQVDENGLLSMVEPSRFIDYPCDRFIRLQSEQGVSQVVSGDHRVIYYDYAGREHIVLADDLLEQYKKKPHTKIKIPSTYLTSGTGIDYSDEYIRLKVAVFADGCFPTASKNAKASYCKILVSKQRKIDRIKRLLLSAGVPYKERVNCRDETTFSFYMDNTDKHFNSSWYSCSPSQLAVICDEVNYWDASVDNHRFFSTDLRSIDFVQYARGACGIRSKVVVTRVGVGVHKTCYAVTEAKTATPSLATNGTGIFEYHQPNGRKYCFTVPTGRLLLRHNGHIFITGNCFNIRKKRGASTLSLHSFGVAVDLNAAWNGFGAKPTLSAGFVKCFTDAGFEWGGTWNTPDGMHFQLKTI